MKFTKMQGIGNDYIYVNCFDEKIDNPSELSIKLSNRNFGIGSDGLVLIMPSQNADFKMRMFNSDGSESEMCGNAIRCVGKYVFDNKLTTNTKISIETLAGLKYLMLIVESGFVTKVRVDMGVPILESNMIPIIFDKERFISEEILINKKNYKFTGVSVGNPHVVTYTDQNLKDIMIEKVGPEVEYNKIFPNKTNVEFVRVLDRKTLEMRVWERGTGETLACGTGACAVLVSSVLNDFSERIATVKLLGGDLLIEWNKDNNHVYMTGAAVEVFKGEINI
ncbi:MAG: diaminopimelate epimerase [Clostridiales bacterium]